MIEIDSYRYTDRPIVRPHKQIDYIISMDINLFNRAYSIRPHAAIITEFYLFHSLGCYSNLLLR